jgi:hypothetical protein
LLSIAQLLKLWGCSTIGPHSGGQDYSHLIVVTSPQIDHDVLVAAVGGDLAQNRELYRGLRTDRRTSRCKDHTAHTSRGVAAVDTVSMPQARSETERETKTHLVEIRYLCDVA